MSDYGIKMLLNRQKMLLHLLERAGGTASRIQIMKWAFLISERAPTGGGSSYYQFLPYHYGPYSFALNREMETLMRDGLVVAPNHNEWSITDAARSRTWALDSAVLVDVAAIMNEFGNMSGDELIDYVYGMFPWVTVNSQMQHRRAMKRPIAPNAIYTVGYEGFSVDALLNLLLVNGITCIIDVRYNPHSRKYGFSKSTLEHLSCRVDIEYNHIPELGIPMASRKNAAHADDYDSLFAAYADNILGGEIQAMELVTSLMAAKPSAVLCFEANPDSCHRSRLAAALKTTIKEKSNGEVVHLGWPRCSDPSNSNTSPQMF